MLSKKLLSLERGKFTGRLAIKSIAGIEWQLYFLHGRLFWGEGGEQENRFWKTHLAQYNLKENWNEELLNSESRSQCSNYYWLTKLLETKTIDLEQLTNAISKQIERIFCDILQLERSGTYLHYKSFDRSGDSILGCCGLKISLTRLNIAKELAIAAAKWQNWRDRGLENISPNLAPIVKKSQQLEKQVSPQVYQNFIKLLDGKRTLRQLAIELEQDLLELTISLKSYFQAGAIELIEIPDLNKEEILNKNYPDNIKITEQQKPLIACVDDSRTTIKILEKIIRMENYNFIGISDPLQAIPTLIVSKPDLIFLDITMPIINGYQLCSQLDRVEKLQNISKIFLTSHDGIVDRFRAKISGACKFIAKPIATKEILKTIEQLLELQSKQWDCQLPTSDRTKVSNYPKIHPNQLLQKT